ncbi:MAG TPA: Hsp20 family protein, partial [Motiliproteus sp.]
MSNLTRFNRLFGDSFFDDFFQPLPQSPSEKMPAIDVHESDEQYLIRADLPGIDKKDIQIKLENGILSIVAESSKEDKEEKEGKLIRQERHYGRFVRQLSVGTDVDPALVKASFADGVLSLCLPKVKEDAVKAVDIKVH